MCQLGHLFQVGHESANHCILELLWAKKVSLDNCVFYLMIWTGVLPGIWRTTRYNLWLYERWVYFVFRVSILVNATWVESLEPGRHHPYEERSSLAIHAKLFWVSVNHEFLDLKVQGFHNFTRRMVCGKILPHNVWFAMEEYFQMTSLSKRKGLWIHSLSPIISASQKTNKDRKKPLVGCVVKFYLSKNRNSHWNWKYWE